MQPALTYASYLESFGIEDAGGRAVEHTNLAVGPFSFFSFRAAGSGEYKAAASADGIVAAGARPTDAWRELLLAGDAADVAGRIAWLESEAIGDPHQGARRLALLTPGASVPALVDPAHWALVQAPMIARGAADAVVLTAWFLPSGHSEPVRWSVVAPSRGPAEIERTRASALVTADDPVLRARGLLASDDRAELIWALRVLGKAGDAQVLDDIVALLTSDHVSVRAEAAAALGRIGDASVIPALAAAFAGEQDLAQRTAIVDAASQIADPAAVDLLADLADREGQVRVRLEIVHALSRRAEQTAAQALERRAEADADASVRRLAATYLQTR